VSILTQKKVIIITDGDLYALKAVEQAAKDLGCRTISQSWGNPTNLSGNEIVHLIKKAPYDPVLVMFDDCGYPGEGYGERAMRYVAKHPDIEVIGAIAVAAKTKNAEWTKVDVSIDRYGNLTEFGIDKMGVPDVEFGRIGGDTVYVLEELDVPYIVGVGDIGKMSGFDTPEKGAPITKQAIQLILERSDHHKSTKNKNSDFD
jgi:stage V sporulation protein AE